MKKILFVLFWASVFAMFLGMVNAVQAAPLLVCDPAPTSDAVTQVQVTSNGVAGAWITYTTQVVGGTLVCVLQDLAPLSNGNYSVTAKFRNSWGDSVASAPFTFTKALPAAPSGMGIK